jgi:hypothetical protein
VQQGKQMKKWHDEGHLAGDLLVRRSDWTDMRTIEALWPEAEKNLIAFESTPRDPHHESVI